MPGSPPGTPAGRPDRVARLVERVRTPAKSIERWYAAYGLLGAALGGLAPILLPLDVSRRGGATEIGLVMAALNLGGLTAPAWGALADRSRRYRTLLISGMACNAVGLVGFALVRTTGGWFALALLQGAGGAAAATVANLFVVERHPRAEWDARIGWLQTFFGGGQVLGLAIAGAFGQALTRPGLAVAAALAGVGALAGLLAPSVGRAVGPAVRPALPRPPRRAEWPPASPQHHYHRLPLSARGGWRELRGAIDARFGRFLLGWSLAYAGSAAVFAVYPVLMRQVYGVAPGLSSPAFALAAGLGLLLYSPAGAWSGRAGASRVVKLGLAGRVLAFGAMYVLGFAAFGGRGWPAMAAFLVVVLCWSLISVGGTALTARLAPSGEGAGMGVFNASTSLSGVLGAVLAGWAGGRFGYNTASAIAMAGVAAGLAVLLLERGERARGGDAGSGRQSSSNEAIGG